MLTIVSPKMANKLVSVGIARTRPRKIPALTGYGYGYVKFSTFSIRYGDEYENVHIPAIISVPVISPSSFKFLKYSQLIK